jgi:beta-lactamase regulating signal transducer with metallopeptidase domain
MTALLIELLVKSALIAGAGLFAAALLGFRPAADRANLLRATVILLIAMPVVALAGPEITVWMDQASPAALPQPTAIAGAIGPVAGVVVEGSVPIPTGAILAVLYSLGSLFSIGRFAVGVWTLARWTRNGRPVTDSAWTAPLVRLSHGVGTPRLLATAQTPAPLSWGLPPGVILIGPALVARPQDAEAVLAHEIAHVRRRDWLFLALSRLALALFWFNPLVWLLHRTLIARSEEAADAVAVSAVAPDAYARTLVGMAAQLTPRAATGMTGHARSLSQRINAIMKTRRPLPARPLTIALAVGALVAVATPLAAVELAARTRDEASVPVAVASAAPAVSLASQSDSAASGDRDTHVTVVNDGTTHRYVIKDGQAYSIQADGSRRPLTDEERREVENARAEAGRAAAAAREVASEVRANAQVQVEHARAAAVHARAMGEHARAQARVHSAMATRAHAVDHAAISAHVARAHAAAQEAGAHAARAHVDHGRIQAQVARQMAQARVQMAAGADQMVRGAQQMRETAIKLRDPAYRAEQIEEARQRGETVTDQQLLDAIPGMLSGADEMEAGARTMRAQGD